MTAPLRPTAVAGLALLLALASLRQPAAEAVIGSEVGPAVDAPAAPTASVERPGHATPAEWGAARPPSDRSASTAAGEPAGEPAVMTTDGWVPLPAAAVDGLDPVASADGGPPADDGADAHEVAVRLAMRLGAAMAGQLPGVIAADPFGASWTMQRHGQPGPDTTMSSLDDQ